MTWTTCLSKSVPYLSAKGVTDAEIVAELLAARLLGIGRGLLANYLEREVEERQLQAMRRGMARLIKGEPIQYVLGEWDFRSLTLKCDSRALIPRPETEELVTRVLKVVKPGMVVVDVGTGSGAIALSLAKEAPLGVGIIATDVSEAAIELARENAELTKLTDRVVFALGDGLDDFDEATSIDIIVSNPPYIESAVCNTLDRKVRDFEPRLALDGGESGLNFYERYLADALNLLKPNGRVFFEIGENQGEALKNMMTSFGFTEVLIEKDYAGHDRYASALLP